MVILALAPLFVFSAFPSPRLGVGGVGEGELGFFSNIDFFFSEGEKTLKRVLTARGDRAKRGLSWGVEEECF